MYNEYFGFKESPFSIAPDPHYLYMTPQHREALAHLVYGLNSDGGCILLTGEVGTGKTTICRCLLEQIPEQANIALLLNPKVTAIELLETICDELKIPCFDKDGTIKTYIDLINSFLLEAHARNEKTVLIIDEAQNLDDSVLEQLRLLTNLETNQRKLLQIVLLGQPELLDILSQEKMRQLAQRITARFHLKALSREELKAYISHRLAVAGQNVQLFPDNVIRKIYQISKGIPRLINVICDRALLGTYVQNKPAVDLATLNQASKEIFGELKNQPHNYSGQKQALPAYAIAAFFALFAITAVIVYQLALPLQQNVNQPVLAANEKTEQNKASEPVTAAEQLETPIVRTATTEAITIDEATQEVVTSDDDRLNALIADSQGNKADVYRHLFGLWNIDYSADENGSACSHAVKHGLSCLHRSGNLHSLRKLNRPAIIKVLSMSGESAHITITRLDDKQAVINNSEKEIIIDAATLDAHWYGDYTLLWQKPPYYNNALKPGNNGPVVQWLDQQLVRIYGQKETPSISDTYSDELVSQVKLFQQSKGLFPDGIAGPRTLIHLNNELGLQAPQLLSVNETRDS